ncbi:MAG: MFS transporter [Schwartzia sp.]|nr:MFS transporter [Schwartzia sp. (in: firmicutes)]
MNWKVVLAVLTGNVIFMASSYTMLIPFLPMYLTHELGVPFEDVNLWSGAVFSASFIVSAIMAPIWGRLADTRGKRLMAIRASLLLSVSYFLGGVVTSPLELVGMRTFQGFAAGLWPMDLAIMTLYAPPDKLGVCLGVMQSAMTAGGVIGPLLGGVLAEAFGMRASFFVASAALMLNCIVFIFVIKEPPDPSRKEAADRKKDAPSAFALLRVPVLRTLLFSSATMQMVILILQPIMTTYITTLAGDLPNIIFVSGLIFSLGGFAGVIAAPGWGWFGQHKGYLLAASIAIPLAGVGLFIQGSVTNLYVYGAMQFVCGLFFCGVHPSLNALLAKNTAPSVKGSIFGLMFAAQQIGSILGPVLGGAVATWLGMKYVFYVAGLVLFSLAIFLRSHKKLIEGT